jgi:hypothetical protein
MNTTETIYKKFELESGRNLEVRIDIEYYTEKNYGADIDGNRGVKMTFIENYTWKLMNYSKEEIADEELTELESLIEKEVNNG